MHGYLAPDFGEPLYRSGRCEAHNGDVGYHGPRGWQGWPDHELGEVMEVDRHTGIAYRCIKVVLTVMHLNHQPEDCRDENLLHACQSCHNRYDAPVRAAGVKARRKAQNAMGDFFCHDVRGAPEQPSQKSVTGSLKES
jgi:hypothetical protein